MSDQDGTSVTNCIFRNNESSCIQINNQWAKRYLKITHCLFEGNVSSNIGTVLSGNSEVYYDFAFNIIRNNTNTSVAGGDSWRNSIIATKKNAQIENCLIVNNSSDNLLIDLQGSTIFNNTIANNKGTIYVGENYSQVVNSIMVNNQPTHNDKAVFTTENSAVQYSASDIEITDNSSTNSVTLLNNIVEANPFVQTTTFVGSTTDETDIQALQNADFSLTSTSLCNNAGSVEFIDEFFMTEEFKKQIETQARQAVTELLAEAKLKKGDVFVVGCSSSEIVGGHIGKDSSLEAAQAVYAGIAPVLAENGIWLAAQCCEHLNRAIIIEREAAEKYGWEEVCVVPRPHAGGSWATTCWKKFREPVAVEEIRAHAGIDIGGTLIGMHLKRVAVPVRLSLSKIGEANILCARTRPKLIGGERAKYTEED